MRWQTLLIDPDAGNRRYVRMVLEEFALVVTECDSVAHAQALPLLRPADDAPLHQRLALLVVDDAAGVEACGHLLEHLRRPQPVSAPLHTVLLGATPQSPLFIDHLLHKPVSATDLRLVLTQVLQALDTASQDLSEADSTVSHTAAPSPDPLRHHADVAHAIATYFEGDAALYHAYREACFAQFPHDVASGDEAHARGDLAALRRCAHSLKSVLLTLGHQGISRQAATVESLSHEGQTEAALAGWLALAGVMRELIANPGETPAG